MNRPEAALAVRLGRALGLPVTTADVLPGGNQNHAIRLRGDDTDVVLRFARSPDRLTGDPFVVEEWCSEAARAVGLPTPPSLIRRAGEDHAVIVQRFVPGTPAQPDDLAAWREIGRFAGAVAAIDTTTAPDELFSRFGRDLDAAWRSHLAYNLAALHPDDALIALGAYDPGQQAAIGRVLRRLVARDLDQGLAHGDLSTRNLITTGPGTYVLVDWGSATTGPAPWTDLEQIHRWHVSGDPGTRVSRAAWRAALDGAGLAERDVLPLLDELAVLHALDVIRWAVDRRPDRLADLLGPSRATLARVVGRFGEKQTCV